jgi:hypothetical protein
MLAELEKTSYHIRTQRAQSQKLFATIAPFAVNLFLVAFQRFAGKVIKRVSQDAKHNH